MLSGQLCEYPIINLQRVKNSPRSRPRPDLNIQFLRFPSNDIHSFGRRSGYDFNSSRIGLLSRSIWYRDVLEVVLGDSLNGVSVCETPCDQQSNSSSLSQDKEDDKQIEAVIATIAAPVNTFLTRNGRRALTNAGPWV